MKKIKSYLILIALAGACASVAKFYLNYKNDQRIFRVAQDRVSLLKVRELLLQALPELQNKTAFDKAVLLRNFFYTRVPLKQTTANFPFGEFYDSVSRSLQGDEGHICGGLAAIYLTALESFAIPGRLVNMYDGTDFKKAPINGHSSVEMHDGKKWIAMDPTYNVRFEDSQGTHLSWIEVGKALQSDQPIQYISDGYPVQVNRDITKYPVPLKSITRYIIATTSRIGNKTETGKLPADWDGIVHQQDATYDMNAYIHKVSPYFARLQEGLLRP